MTNKPLSPEQIKRFRATVRAYYKKEGRSLPWRVNNDPYRIFVSEVMLQQTQVDRVTLKFPPFVAAFPDFPTLARAPLAQVFSLWQGLGYNRRALAMKKAAETVMNEFSGNLPDHPDLLVRLPGIGPATAASICAFAFNRPVVFLETNIRTVLIHHFFREKRAVTDGELLPAASAVLDRSRPREWYSALMDYGTMLKKTHGNASRRSAHYTRQSRFEGSRRQIRGGVLKALLARPSQTIEEIARALSAPPETVLPVASMLVREGILTVTRSKYRIPRSTPI